MSSDTTSLERALFIAVLVIASGCFLLPFLPHDTVVIVARTIGITIFLFFVAGLVVRWRLRRCRPPTAGGSPTPEPPAPPVA